ncbi:Atypical/ABC1/ABC1-A protein kinase [Diaporthe helianthi]|uniref:Atypical/ABC1/ABC1-A protein kinase n=1 Tax=Diaporthe helianthi TaxID=158607 RepID=A0A2P5HYG4_DIAHE|nr:Atypical/ABC1/ABC1-A protein kinase [Diaporthe helianthi]
MGLVDFAIDLAAVLNASRSVASKHIALRARQVDRFGKTSSIVAAVRGQQRIRPHDVSRVTPTDTGEKETTQPLNTDNGTRIPADTSSSKTILPDNVSESATTRKHPFPASLSGSDGSNHPEAQADSPGSKTPLVVQSHIKAPTVDEVIPRDTKQRLEKDPSPGAEEIKLPEDVGFDGLFRTSRGRRLDPLWKGTKRNERPRQPIPGAVDFGHRPANQGSAILQELRNRKNEAEMIPSHEVGEPQPERSAAPTQAAEAALPVDPVETREPQAELKTAASVSESRKVPQLSVPGAEASTLQEQDTRQPSQRVTKEDASAMGELLGTATNESKYELRESKVPSSRFGRIWNYSGLAAGMFAGAVSESFSRVTGGGGQGSLMLSPANMERLVSKLSKMRGAALKLGQMMSFQDSKMLPAPIQEVLQRVQDRADYMPSWQRDRVLVSNLGPEWRDIFDDFEEKPIAAASIGQVHRATLKNGDRVAVKIQFPGVAESINSDLDNLGILLAATKLLPKGLYLNKTIDNARTELGWECDYEREAKCAERYRSLLATEDDVFSVPNIYPEACGKQVLTMEFMDGVGVTRIKSFTQEQRDWIGTQILRLCLREITEFRFMQTDPNWTNFLYNAERDRLVLLDFGASREYPDEFITQYVQLLAAASRTDREGVRVLSEQLGYLTGHESKTMLDAHIASVLTLAEPFLDSAPEVYDFRDQTITERVKEQIPVMIRERLAPPPEETYSLHRKLSGAFLLCARLGSRVRCREMFEQSLAKSALRDKQV